MKNGLMFTAMSSLVTLSGVTATNDLSSSTLFRSGFPDNMFVRQSFDFKYPIDNISMVQTTRSSKNPETANVLNENTLTYTNQVEVIKAPVKKRFKAKIKVRSVSNFEPKLSLE